MRTARPMIEELQRTDYDLSHLAVIGTGGTPTSFEAKRGLVELLPHVTIRDGYGASETGVMASGETVGDTREAQRFPLSSAVRLVSGDRSRFLEAGDEEVGWIARVGHVPLGYLDDEDASEATFPVVAGVRVSIPGDRAQYIDDRQVVLLGRDSLVVNTGGEKVFVEEVEDALEATRRRRRRAGGRAAERAVRPGGHRHRAARARCHSTAARAARVVQRAPRPLQVAAGVRVRRAGRAVPERQGELPVGP